MDAQQQLSNLQVSSVLYQGTPAQQLAEFERLCLTLYVRQPGSNVSH